MTETWTLSDKIGNDADMFYPFPVISLEDVKEFIKRLKEEILYNHQGYHSSVSDVCNKIIDELAGEKLIQ